MISLLRSFLIRDFWSKLFALVLATLIWFTVWLFAIRKEVEPSVLLHTVESEPTLTFSTIPLRIMSSAADVRSYKVDPSEVQVTVRGTARQLQELHASEIRALVDLTDFDSSRSTRQQIEVTAPAGITVERVTPNEADVAKH